MEAVPKWQILELALWYCIFYYTKKVTELIGTRGRSV
jgi:hypothetical protein